MTQKMLDEFARTWRAQCMTGRMDYFDSVVAGVDGIAVMQRCRFSKTGESYAKTAQLDPTQSRSFHACLCV